MRRVVKVSRIRIIITIIVVVLTTLLTGCTGKEPNEIAYVVALGIDSTDDDNYKITIQYANTTQISGGASESGGKAGSEIVDNVTIEAPNIYAGVGLANNIVSKSFSMSHAKLIVFSKEVAEKGVKDMIETLVRSEEIRPDVFIAVANTTANDYLTSVNPEMEVNPAQYYQLIYQKNQLVGIPDGQLREFFTGLYTDNYDSILPVAGVIRDQAVTVKMMIKDSQKTVKMKVRRVVRRAWTVLKVKIQMKMKKKKTPKKIQASMNMI